MDMEVCFMTYYLHKAHYSCKFQFFVTAKSDQDPDPYTDPHEYGHLDPDPHWSIKLDPDPDPALKTDPQKCLKWRSYPHWRGVKALGAVSPCVRDPDPDIFYLLDPVPDFSINKQKIEEKPWFLMLCDFLWLFIFALLCKCKYLQKEISIETY